MIINGTTNILAVIGHPIRHSASPRMQNAMIQKVGLDYVYVPLNINPNELHQAMDGFSAMTIKGFNVTIPFKETIIPFLDEQDDLSAAIGAVNTVVNDRGVLKGYNTDGNGFLLSLKEELNFEYQTKVLSFLTSINFMKIANEHFA